MGKLRQNRVIQYLIVPILALVLMIGGYLILRQFVSATSLPLFGNSYTSVTAYTKNIHGFSQVVISYHADVNEEDPDQSQEIVLTDDRVNNVDVFSRGEYVVWVRELGEENQLIRYHVPTRQDVVIDQGGIFEFPKVDSRGQVAWQRWDDTQQSWFISYYSGKVKNTMHQGIYPDIKDTLLLYSQKNEVGDWQLLLQDIKKGHIRVLLSDPAAKLAWFGVDTIQFAGGSISLDKSLAEQTSEEAITPLPFIDTAENTPEKKPGVESDVPPGDAWIYNGENPPSD